MTQRGVTDVFPLHQYLSRRYRVADTAWRGKLKGRLLERKAGMTEIMPAPGLLPHYFCQSCSELNAAALICI